MLEYRLHPEYTLLGISDGLPIPVSISDACYNPKWTTGIDREYKLLIRRNTWTYVKHSDTMHPVPFKWMFRAKKLGKHREELPVKGTLCFARRHATNIRGLRPQKPVRSGGNTRDPSSITISSHCRRYYNGRRRRQQRIPI